MKEYSSHPLSELVDCLEFTVKYVERKLVVMIWLVMRRVDIDDVTHLPITVKSTASLNIAMNSTMTTKY